MIDAYQYLTGHEGYRLSTFRGFDEAGRLEGSGGGCTDRSFWQFFETWVITGRPESCGHFPLVFNEGKYYHKYLRNNRMTGAGDNN